MICESETKVFGLRDLLVNYCSCCWAVVRAEHWVDIRCIIGSQSAAHGAQKSKWIPKTGKLLIWKWGIPVYHQITIEKYALSMVIGKTMQFWGTPFPVKPIVCSIAPSLHPLVGREGTYPISNPHQICQVGDGWSVAIHLQWPTADPLFAGTNGTYFLRGLDGGQDGWHPDFSSSKTTSFAAEQMSRCHQMSFITMVRDSWRVIHAIQCFSCRTLSEFANPHCPGRNCAIDRALGEANPHAFARHVHLPSEGMPQQPGNLPISVDCTRITRLKTEMLEVFECIWMYLNVFECI